MHPGQVVIHLLKYVFITPFFLQLNRTSWPCSCRTLSNLWPQGWEDDANGLLQLEPIVTDRVSSWASSISWAASISYQLLMTSTALMAQPALIVQTTSCYPYRVYINVRLDILGVGILWKLASRLSTLQFDLFNRPFTRFLQTRRLGGLTWVVLCVLVERLSRTRTMSMLKVRILEKMRSFYMYMGFAVQ